jgi:hypothetical protein
LPLWGKILSEFKMFRLLQRSTTLLEKEYKKLIAPKGRNI